jgi:FKBP-type peptidyl-prolyl cis-trans isomerase
MFRTFAIAASLVVSLTTTSFAQTLTIPGQKPKTTDPAPAAAAEGETEPQSYVIGLLVGQFLAQQGIKFEDFQGSSLIQGIEDGISRKEPRLPQETCQSAMQGLQQVLTSRVEEMNAADAETMAQFLKQNGSEEGVKTTESGLQYKPLTSVAEGAKPGRTSVVKVHYVGMLINGTKFDSSIDRGQPAEFPLNRVIPGWTEGLQLMKVGEKFRFVIPGKLAYGPRGQPDAGIGPNEVLIFEVELLEILKP